MPVGGEIDVVEAERRMVNEPGLASELGAAAGFLRAGGELAVIGPAERLPGAFAGNDTAPGLLRIRRTVGKTSPEYQYERDVEQFFRHSPAVVRDDA